MWSKVLDLMVAKEHLTLDGLSKIVAFKSHFPQGLSLLLSQAFPSLPSIPKPEFTLSAAPLDPNWIVGFVNGDGHFTLGFQKSSSHRLGFTCKPLFKVSQHPKDAVLLERIAESLGCGS